MEEKLKLRQPDDDPDRLAALIESLRQSQLGDSLK
jgi:hypothetical protein